MGYTSNDKQAEQANSPDARVRPADEERHAIRATLQRPMVALRAAHRADRTVPARVAEGLVAIGSSTAFLVMHLVWFTMWIAWNTGLLGFPMIDPFPFGLLTMIVSLEAICLAIFVLIGQGREAAIAELREELAVQINLRIEAEVTKGLQLVAGLYTRLGFRFSEDDELREMLKALDPKSMEQELVAQIKSITARN
jgi:uncharacterized membrane protein